MVRSTWALAQAGPVPRVYELTPAGDEALEQCTVALGELQAMTRWYLTRCGAVTAPPAPPAER